MPTKKPTPEERGADMTPMIDVTFQLLIFFMVVINFSDADNSQRVNLPKSDLAIPPDKPLEDQVTLQVAPRNQQHGKRHLGSVILVGAAVVNSPAELVPFLKAEVDALRQKSRGHSKTVKDITVIIRADSDTKTGFVQEIIQICQKNGFEKFALRAQQNEKPEKG